MMIGTLKSSINFTALSAVSLIIVTEYKKLYMPMAQSRHPIVLYRKLKWIIAGKI